MSTHDFLPLPHKRHFPLRNIVAEKDHVVKSHICHREKRQAHYRATSTPIERAGSLGITCEGHLIPAREALQFGCRKGTQEFKDYVDKRQPLPTQPALPCTLLPLSPSPPGHGFLLAHTHTALPQPLICPLSGRQQRTGRCRRGSQGAAPALHRVLCSAQSQPERTPRVLTRWPPSRGKGSRDWEEPARGEAGRGWRPVSKLLRTQESSAEASPVRCFPNL